MAVTNDFLPFASTDTGTNLESQSAYLADPNRLVGNIPGPASSKFNNKALRQATFVISQIAQYIANTTNTNVFDNANPSQFLAQMVLALTNPYGPPLDITTSTTLTTANNYVRATGTLTATLPPLASSIGMVVTIKATGGGTPTVTVQANASELIDRVNNLVLQTAFNESITLYNSEGTVWDVL